MLTAVAVVALSTMFLGSVEPPSDAEISAAADRLAAEALKQPGAAGLSVAVSRNGKVIHSKGYGLAEVEHGVAADEHTVFRIGSITKQFTAAAVMKLVEQGKVKLDEPIATYLPDYNDQDAGVTVRHLLTHTSGIKSYTELRRVMVEEPERRFKHEELLTLFQDEPLGFKPGTKFKYNNSGYYLLGMIVEKVSGKAYCEFEQEEILAPVGLSHTRCDSNSEIIKGRAQGYTLAGGKMVNDRGLATTTPFSAGMLLASARDLVVWSDALADGKVVSKDSYAQMCTPYTLADGKSTKYGFGLGVDQVHGRTCVEHGGGIFGFNSMLTRYPDDGLTVAVISNSEAVRAGVVADKICRVALGVGGGEKEQETAEKQAPR